MLFLYSDRLRLLSPLHIVISGTPILNDLKSNNSDKDDDQEHGISSATGAIQILKISKSIPFKIV